MSEYDFGGYATRTNIRCSDGRTIMPNAFSDNDGETVPLVWQHQHNDAQNILGHAVLENRPDGVYAYGVFNDTESGQNARKLVEHGDIDSLSIFANNLTQRGGDVTNGAIREVSLVLAGANPGAYIDDVAMSQADDGEGEAVIFMGSGLDTESIKHEGETMASDGNVFDGLTDEQFDAIDGLLAEAYNNGVDALANELDNDENYDNDDEFVDVEHSGMGDRVNVFDNSMDAVDALPSLSHAQFDTIMSDAQRIGSLKESVLSHANDYGIKDVDILFPDARAIQNTPEFVKRKTEWVTTVLNGCHHSPFSRIKTIHADITADEARAKGYVTGRKKIDEVIKLSKRSVISTTIYKKQRMDRKDIVDITSFDVIAWLKAEMRLMLDEELARAILVGDGRQQAAEDKIDEECIKPIWKDDDFYALHKVADKSQSYTQLVDDIVRGMADYRGTGRPTLFVPPSVLTELLLIKDESNSNRRLYHTQEELASALRCSSIVEVPVLENQKRTVSAVERQLTGIAVNLDDYTIGADKGGEISMFDDFDIDYNQQKYLIETFVSGMLTRWQSAIVFEKKTA